MRISPVLISLSLLPSCLSLLPSPRRDLRFAICDLRLAIFVLPASPVDDDADADAPRRSGLFGFASTTFILSMYNAQARGITTPNVVIGMAFFVGGLAQFVAGMWEFACANAFGATGASCSSIPCLLRSTGGVGAAVHWYRSR